MPLVYPNVFHNIERHWIFHIKRSEVEHIPNTFFRHILKKFLRRTTVRINKSQTVAVLNILNGHILKKSGFPHAGFADDRSKHIYVIGTTGMGKSTLLENMAIQDIQNGNGLAFIDPHGGTAEKLLEYVPEERIRDVLYFAPFDMEYPVSFNIMEDVGVN